MSSTPKRFTRYEAEFHAPETQYVLAEEHDALVAELQSTRTEHHRASSTADFLFSELERQQAFNAQIMDPIVRAKLMAEPAPLVVEATAERDRLQRMADTLTRELADAQAELKLEQLRHNATSARLEDERQNATRYPVENPANPLLVVESGGIRYELEVMTDEDGDYFEVKSATPTESVLLADFVNTTYSAGRNVFAAARQALAAWRENHNRDAEESRAD